jgi:hypothetical protein
VSSISALPIINIAEILLTWRWAMINIAEILLTWRWTIINIAC